MAGQFWSPNPRRGLRLAYWGLRAVLVVGIGFGVFLFVARETIYDNADLEGPARSVVMVKSASGSAGSGFVIQAGQPFGELVITNAHVVEGAEFVEIYSPWQDKSVTGKVLGSDPRLDLAAIALGSELRGMLPALSLGNSDNLRPQQPLEALGFPSTGISGRLRSFFKNVAQTPARFLSHESYEGTEVLYIYSPGQAYGSSGGPVIDTEKRVVGVNTEDLFGKPINKYDFLVPSNAVAAFLRDSSLLPEPPPEFPSGGTSSGKASLQL